MANSIVPNLWFNGNAREAVDFYVSVFADAKVLHVDYYTDYGEEITGHKKGDIVTIEFELLGTRFIAINAGPQFKFNLAVSFLIRCKDQKEIDYYWERLSSNADDEQCGWARDKFGLSWQIAPIILEEMLMNGDERQRRNLTEAYMDMKKFDISKLEEAYRK